MVIARQNIPPVDHPSDRAASGTQKRFFYIFMPFLPKLITWTAKKPPETYLGTEATGNHIRHSRDTVRATIVLSTRINTYLVQTEQFSKI